MEWERKISKEDTSNTSESIKYNLDIKNGNGGEKKRQWDLARNRKSEKLLKGKYQTSGGERLRQSGIRKQR